MRIKMIAKVTYFCIMLTGGFSLVHIDVAGAAAKVFPREMQSLTSSLVAASNPELICVGSGELTGNHPGWSSPKAIKLTLVGLANSGFGAYWCPASAPNGKGVISYTVTAASSGITCETTDTQCAMFGITPETTLNIMATDKSGSYPIIGSAYQNSGEIISSSRNTDSNLDIKSDALSSYGNDEATGIKSCTFAAVANWEHVVLGLTPDPVIINADFQKSGGATAGLSNNQVFAYWITYGIGGVHLKTVHSQFTDPVSLKEVVGDSKIKAVIAQLYFSKGQNFAGVQMTNSAYHWVVIDGFTATGPLAITWGKTLQMTWQQWNVEALSAWTITGRNNGGRNGI